MASKHFTPFVERKASRSGPHLTVKSGMPASTPPALHDSPPGYKPAGRVWGTSLNRKVKAPVVKTRVKKDGLD